MNRPPQSGLSFLLAQIGAHASARFAERLEPLGLTPPHAGILRILRRQPGITQRTLAQLLGIFPSRLVLLLHDLEEHDLVSREASPSDRRSHALKLTPLGEKQIEAIGRVVRQHEDDLCASLGEAERALLTTLLEKIADQQKLRPGVHPGYRKLNER